MKPANGGIGKERLDGKCRMHTTCAPHLRTAKLILTDNYKQPETQSASAVA
jgi:hypothetical protein